MEAFTGERFTAVTSGALVLLLPMMAIRGDSALEGQDAGEAPRSSSAAPKVPGEPGVNGRLPEDGALSPGFHDDLERGDLGRSAGRFGQVPGGTLGIPGVVLAAYQRAADSLAESDPACGLHWSVLAGIGRIESNHARGGQVDGSGRTFSPILGPRLDGGPGIAAIPDTENGLLDGDAVWDRAVGPMQFIPSTWRSYASSGADPHNVFDAALASGHYLCTGGANLRDRSGLAAAIFRYNPSETYVRAVLVWADRYARGVVPTEGLPPGSPDPGGSLLDAAPGAPLDAPVPAPAGPGVPPPPPEPAPRAPAPPAPARQQPAPPPPAETQAPPPPPPSEEPPPSSDPPPPPPSSEEPPPSSEPPAESTPPPSERPPTSSGEATTAPTTTSSA